MSELKSNVLYYGDNLDILREHIPDESVDLIYLDPPFNSKRSYNILFRESSGAASDAQIEAFEDSWHWGPMATKAYEEVVMGPHQKVARMLRAMVEGLGHNDVTAYLVMMAVRLVELHRVLKLSGSIYLHCDPTIGHYLKVILDSVFSPKRFINEIAWCYYIGGCVSKRAYGRRHDILLFYTKSDSYTFNWGEILEPWSEKGKAKFRYEDEKGRYRLMGRNLKDSPIKSHRDVSPEWEKTHPHLVYRHYMKKGRMGLDYWNISPINQASKERIGYQTQKPQALLERIISASSNPGDIVLDPFCGCGTAMHAANKMERRWIGIDITYLAINLIERRMRDAFDDIEIDVIGEPKDLASAHDLAKRDKWQFQWWALTKINAQPVAGKKKGADRGIDGVIPFFAGPEEDYKRAIVSVKGGEHVGVAVIRDLVGVIERENEPIGILLSLVPPTQPMITEAAAAGLYESEFWGRKFPRVQIITIEEMFKGTRPELPWGKSPYAKAPKEHNPSTQLPLI